ncbi:cyanophycinase [Sphingomonas sp. LY160]|uniref:cyanophycinase n=1 Tax=Sphingomonas sp. LY160 TaxID=3095342 RepID=UPI002ADEFA30|nr:cyanophycinase [Sphingomonas sp. LY160]MEA1071582.1 cyanophycinase [Sphingomonas sp. LY160]
MPAAVHHGDERGYIIPIGGSEDKDAHPVILKRVLALAGGRDANIVILPTASRLEETGSYYERVFTKLGVGQVSSIPIATRSDCNNPEFAERCAHATGIFLTGGNQLRLSSILGGTAVAQMIRRKNATGTLVAGTSAGASIMSEHMLAGGDPDKGPSGGGVVLAPGLGLTNAAVIDQHFSQRNRLGRLLSAVSLNPFLLGMGIDEDTAAFIDPHGMVEVVGSGTVTVVDGSAMSYSSAHSVSPSQGIGMIGLKLDILDQGCRYDLGKREAYPPDERPKSRRNR